MSNENRFKQAMAMLAAVYQNPMQPEVVKSYWEFLGNCNPDHLDKAVSLHIKDEVDGKFFPKPSSLLAHVGQMVEKEKREKYFIDQQAKKIEKKPRTPEQIETGLKAIAKMKGML